MAKKKFKWDGKQELASLKKGIKELKGNVEWGESPVVIDVWDQLYNVHNIDLTEDRLLTAVLEYAILKPLLSTLTGSTLIGESSITRLFDVLVEEQHIREKIPEAIDDYYIKFFSFYSEHECWWDDDGKGDDLLPRCTEFMGVFHKLFSDERVLKEGVVYTPKEAVDFINNSVAKIIEEEFADKITMENVVMLDPFGGTGIFNIRFADLNLTKEQFITKYNNGSLRFNDIDFISYYINLICMEKMYFQYTKEYKECTFGSCKDTFKDL